MQDNAEAQGHQQGHHLDPVVLFPDPPFPLDGDDGDHLSLSEEEQEEEQEEETLPSSVILHMCYHEAPHGQQLALFANADHCAIVSIAEHPRTPIDQLPWPMEIARRIDPSIDLSGFHSFAVRNESLGYTYAVTLTHDDATGALPRGDWLEWGCPLNHPHVLLFGVHHQQIQLDIKVLQTDVGLGSCRVLELVVDNVDIPWDPVVLQNVRDFFGEEDSDGELSEEDL